MKRLVILGDSHLGALKRGLDKLIESNLQFDFSVIDFHPIANGKGMSRNFFSVVADKIIFNNRARSEFSLTGCDKIVYLSGPIHSTRLISYISWTFKGDSQAVDIDKVYSSGFLESVILNDCGFMLNFINVLQNNGYLVGVIEAPAPFTSTAFFRRNSAATIKYIDWKYRSFVKGFLIQNNVEIIELPRDCLDSNGFMLDIYRGGDSTHANDVYGVRMMKLIIQQAFGKYL
jgi:hypothetical protein